MFMLIREYLISFKIFLSYLPTCTEFSVAVLFLKRSPRDPRRHTSFPEGLPLSWGLSQALELKLYKFIPIFTPKSLIN